jgi:hypothetical protein
MGAREELLAAAWSLADRGIAAFSPAQLIAEARSHGSSYPDSTLPTFIVSAMCANAPDHHGLQHRDLERVARGLYRLASGDGGGPEPAPVGPEALVDFAVESTPAVGKQMEPATAGAVESKAADDEWFWEGNVQAAVVSHLAATGWRIRRVANTATSEHGVDIEADRAGERLLVEVKGYPGSTYARGERKGAAKTGRVGAQARTYFSNALLSGLLMRAEAEGARVALAFPGVPTFENLGRRVVGPLTAAQIEVWLVAEDGTVTELKGP